jgi:hypothetical protein
MTLEIFFDSFIIMLFSKPLVTNGYWKIYQQKITYQNHNVLKKPWRGRSSPKSIPSSPSSINLNTFFYIEPSRLKIFYLTYCYQYCAKK